MISGSAWPGNKNKRSRRTSLFSTTNSRGVLSIISPGPISASKRIVEADGPAGHSGLKTADTILAVSSRTSFEIVQKAAVAGIPILCAVSAPSSLAVDAARRVDLLLRNDPGTGVMRHADAGYQRAREVAAERGIRLPSADG